VLSGIARAARGGVLVKGGVHLENLGRVRAIAFDKTGTLTRGRPEVTDIISLNGRASDEILSLAAAVERGSTHPLAKAIVAEAKAHSVAEIDATEIEQVPGRGMAGRVNGAKIMLGSADRADLGAATRDLESKGRTTVLMLIDGRPEAVLATTVGYHRYEGAALVSAA
jgi:Cd2+/Zn2+-exporting ATPase